MRCKILEEKLNPKQREQKILKELYVDDFSLKTINELISKYPDYEPLQLLASDIKHLSQFERTNYCYCALPLTGVGFEEQKLFKKEHMGIRDAIEKAGIKIYDPVEAPFNPQYGLIGGDGEVSDVDALMVLTSRFLEFTNVDKTTGCGIEERGATAYYKIPLIMIPEQIWKKKERFPSRLSTGTRRVIPIEYSNLEKDGADITQIFEMLKEFKGLGVGNCSVHGNMITGYENGKPVCLRGLVEYTFPKFKYDFTKYLKK